MSSERTRIALIFAVVGALAVGGGVYFFAVFRPHQVRDAAQTEIRAWETRWAAARGCLVGSSPVPASTSEILAIRTLSPAGDESPACVDEIRALTRDNTEDTGLPEVEAAWDQVEHGVSKVAAAFATHIDPGGERQPVEDPLGAAIDALDTTRGTLRAAAGLPAESGLRDHLPVATIVELRAGSDALAKLDGAVVPSGTGVVAFSRVGAADHQVVLVAGAAPSITTVVDGGERSVTDPTWGAIATTGGIRIGAFAADGTLPDATPPATTLALKGEVQTLAVIGKAADGTVVYGAGDHLMTARATAGVFVAAPPILVDRVLFATDAASGSTALAWSDAKGALHGAFVQAATGVTTPIELGNDQPDTLCVTGEHAWLRTTRSALIQFGATGPAQPPLAVADHALRGCTRDGAILENVNGGGDGALVVCGASCRPSKLHAGNITTVATAVGGKVYAFGARDGVLAIYGEGDKPRYVGAPGKLTLLSATSDGKVFDVLAKTAAGLAIVRVPIS